MYYNEEYEFCIGKKNKFPEQPLIFQKHMKNDKTIKEEEKLVKKCETNPVITSYFQLNIF